MIAIGEVMKHLLLILAYCGVAAALAIAGGIPGLIVAGFLIYKAQ